MTIGGCQELDFGWVKSKSRYHGSQQTAGRKITGLAVTGDSHKWETYST